MKSRKWAIIISYIIMSASLIIFSMLIFRLYPNNLKIWLIENITFINFSDWKNFFIAISSGTFTSSIVTLLISSAEYRVERESAIEDYIESTIIFCADFYNMEYLNIDMPIELLQGYYAELWNKPIDFVLGKSNKGYIYNDEHIIPDSDTVIKIKDWIWNCSLNEETRKMYETSYKKKEYLDEEFERMIQKYSEEIDVVMKQYIDLSDKISSRRLTSTIAKIDFLFGNKYRKDVLHKKMYSQNREIIDKINNVSLHFRNYYKSSVEDRAVALHFIQEIQNYIFSVEERKNGYAKIVYNQYLFKMNCEINNALRKLYGKKRYHDELPKIENFMVLALWKDTDEFA